MLKKSMPNRFYSQCVVNTLKTVVMSVPAVGAVWYEVGAAPRAPPLSCVYVGPVGLCDGLSWLY